MGAQLIGTAVVRSCTQALRIRRFLWSKRVLGDDHPDTLGTAAKLVIALSELGRHKRASALAEETLPLARQVLGADHPDTLACERNVSASRED